MGLEEFKRWQAALGVDESTAQESFQRLDGDSGRLSIDELVNAVRDFHERKLDVSVLGR